MGRAPVGRGRIIISRAAERASLRASFKAWARVEEEEEEGGGTRSRKDAAYRCGSLGNTPARLDPILLRDWIYFPLSVLFLPIGPAGQFLWV